MSVKFMEGFGYCADGAAANPPAPGDDLLTQWVYWYLPPIIGPVESGDLGVRKYAASQTGAFPGNSTNLISKAWEPSASSRCVIGYRIYRQTSGTNVIVMYLWDIGTTGILSDGKVSWSWSWGIGGGSDEITSTSAIAEDSWAYVEIEIDMAISATGSVNIYIDGNLDASVSNSQTIISTSTRGPHQIECFPGYGSARADWRITDIYIDDDVVHGLSEVWYQPCDTAGSLAQFTPLSGDNEDNVDDIGNDGDTTYNSSSSPGSKDRLTHSSAITFGPIAVQPILYGRGVGEGTALVKLGVRSNGTESLASLPGLTSQFEGRVGPIFTEDPDTSDDWTAEGVNAAETVVQHGT
jgi:hypothetical protein